MRAVARQVVTEAVVIRRQDYGDSDRIVELLTPELGRVSAFAAGARASRRRFQGTLELFASIDAQLVERRGLWRLDGASLRDVRLGIRGSLEQIERATILLDVARSLAPEHHEARDMHRALCAGLDAVARAAVAEAVVAYPRMLAAAGLLPPLDVCSLCGEPLGARLWLDVSAAQTTCERCPPRGIELAPAVAAVWRRQTCEDTRVADAVEKTIQTWLSTQLGRAPHCVGAITEGLNNGRGLT